MVLIFHNSLNRRNVGRSFKLIPLSLVQPGSVNLNENGKDVICTNWMRSIVPLLWVLFLFKDMQIEV